MFFSSGRSNSNVTVSNGNINDSSLAFSFTLVTKSDKFKLRNPMLLIWKLRKSHWTERGKRKWLQIIEGSFIVEKKV